MSFRETIRNLQNMPYAKRKQILWTTVGITAVALIIIWLLTLQYRTRPVGPDRAKTGFKEIFQNLKTILPSRQQ